MNNDIRKYILEKFSDINFIEESHQYFIDEKEYTPVSHIIDEYVPYVDWDEKASDYAKKYRKIKEEVQKEWKLKNLQSTISGTNIHEFGESYTNLLMGYPELICDSKKKQYIEEYNTLLPIHPKEEAIISFYKNILSDSQTVKMKPVGAELKLSTQYIENTKPICGTCDLLFEAEDIFSEEKYYVLADWKTNAKLYNDYNRTFGGKMLPPFNLMVEEPLSHYIIQFNLYRRMLESVGVNIGDMILIWLKERDYEIINIPKIDNKIIDSIIKKRD